MEIIDKFSCLQQFRWNKTRQIDYLFQVFLLDKPSEYFASSFEISQL